MTSNLRFTILFCTLAGCASTSSGRASLSYQNRVSVQVVLDEADAAMAILEKEISSKPVAEADWQRLFASEGYRRLKEREAAMQRAFTDAEFKSFIQSDTLVRRTAALRATVAGMRTVDVSAAAARALEYLPSGASIAARLYAEVKPRTNSFVFSSDSIPGILIYVDPLRSRAVFENTLAHELHHIGLSSACRNYGDPALSEPLKTLVRRMGAFGEGFAMLAAAGGPDVNAHRASDSATQARWNRDVANHEANLRHLEKFFLDVTEGRVKSPDSVVALASQFYGEQGPWYTVGWKMAVVIEKTFGRRKLIDVMCDPVALLATYNLAVPSWNKAAGETLPLWSDRLLNGLVAKPVASLSMPGRPEVSSTHIEPPATVSSKPFADTLHGVVIADPLRWMEDTANAETRKWIASQASYTDSIFSKVVGRDSIAARLEKAYSDAPTLGTVAETPAGLILSRWLGPRPSLVAIARGQGAEREIISAAAIGKTGNNASMRAFVPSWNGRFIAIGTTERGDANPAISIIDAASGKVLDRIPDLITSMEGTRYRVTWLADGTGFFYPRGWPGSKDAPASSRLARGRQFLHKIGTPQSADVPIFGFEVVPSIAIDRDDLPTRITTGPDSRWLVASVYRSKLSGSDYYAALFSPGVGKSRKWTKIASVEDRIGTPQLRGDTLYALSRRDADRGKVIRRILGNDSAWTTVLPEMKGVITSFTMQNDALYATERTGGSMILLRLSNESSNPVSVSLPMEGTISLYRGHTGMDGALLSIESWATPPEWMRVEANASEIRQLGLNGSSYSAESSLVATRTEAQSKDGTLVPVSLVYGSAALRNGKLDGSAPLLVEAYGGFGSSTDPSYNPALKVWVDLGGVYAYAHVRGGGELGDAWHKAATREKKQTTIDDVIGVVEHLIAERYTSAGRVALMGISSGAIIPGLAMIERPELFGLALFDVGQPDEIRGVALDPTAARNISELGDIDTPQGVRLLQNASPYYRVPERVALPAVIVHTSLDDYNFGTEMLAGKYVARLQKANSGSRPVIWVRTPGGHTPLLAMSPEIAATAFSFILWQTGHPAFQP